MKRTLFLIILFFSISAHAQIKDLAALASGEFVAFQPIFDQDAKLFGYFILFDQGKANEKNKKFEYILLDKNLNKVSSNTFQGDKTLVRYAAYLDINRDLILEPYIDPLTINIWKIGKFVFPEYKRIDLNTNEISTYYGKCFKDNAFIDCEPNEPWREERRNLKEELKEKGYIDNSSVRILKNRKLFVRQSKDYVKYVKDNVIMYFDENEKMVWKYEYNNFADKKNRETLRVIDIDENALYGLTVIKKNKETNYKLTVLDINTGEVLAKKTLPTTLNQNTLESLVNSDVLKAFDDKIVIFGYNVENDKVNGYARLLIDKKNYNIKGSTIYYVEDLKSHIPKIDKYGGVESGYYLLNKDVFFLKDGSVAILNEKFRSAVIQMKTTDMVFIYTNEDFKVKSVKILEKEKSKGQFTDYLYSQYLNDDENVVFFYKDFKKDDETKDKNWTLFINTLLNGEFKQEQVVISSEHDKFVILPYIAKEGYILLREFNEKDKYNQIRLEKLNY
jgi:hypothetical protein